MNDVAQIPELQKEAEAEQPLEKAKILLVDDEPKSLFALPLNARYQHFNASGQERARLASTNNFCMMLNLFHNDEFVFNNPYEFPERQGSQKAFSGEGDFIPVRPGRNMWETNFVPDLAAFELKEWKARGAGG